MKEKLRRLLTLIPWIGRYFKIHVPPGHYHSPTVNKKDIQEKAEKIFHDDENRISGIDLHEKAQLELLDKFREYYREMPFTNDPKSGLRYHFSNGFYAQSDGVFLHSVIRHFKPKRIIEAGSGYSSALILDTNDLFFGGEIELSFIEPYPERLYSLLDGEDKRDTEIITTKLEDVPLQRFDELDENDILFIDSTHVSKTGSDVNYAFFEILPRLKPGVLIHFHDVFFPFEYPPSWVLEWDGFGWNEAYMLRAFLMYNKSFEVVLFNTFLEHKHKEWFAEHMPVCLENTGGSIWIRKH